MANSKVNGGSSWLSYGKVAVDHIADFCDQIDLGMSLLKYQWWNTINMLFQY